MFSPSIQVLDAPVVTCDRVLSWQIVDVWTYMDRTFFRAETRLILVSYLFTPSSQAAESVRDSSVVLNVEWRHFLEYRLLRFASSYIRSKCLLCKRLYVSVLTDF